MRCWIRVGLATTATTTTLAALATLAGMVALTPAAHAAAGTAFSTGRTPAAPAAAGRTHVPAAPVTRTRTPAGRTLTRTTPAASPFAVLPPELLTCIAAQANHFDRVSFNQVCQQWHTVAHQSPVSVHNIRVVRTHVQLTAALAQAQAGPVEIVIVPAEDLVVENAPVNPRAHITIHDTQKLRQSVVKVRADIHVTVSGTASVRAYQRSQVTASGTATVTAYKSAQVTASDFATVWAYDSAKVTASDFATVWAYNTAQVAAYDATLVHAADAAVVVVHSEDVDVF